MVLEQCFPFRNCSVGLTASQEQQVGKEVYGVGVHQALDCSIVRSFIPCHLVTTDACHLTVA